MPLKRFKDMETTIDVEEDGLQVELSAEDKVIAEHKLGRFTVSFMCLCEPPVKLLCRAIDKKWVNEIKRELRSMPNEHTTIIPCLVDKKDLNEPRPVATEDLHRLRIYTLGGNHLRTAVQELLQEEDNNHLDSLRNVEIDLYAGLTNSQARRVGNGHNIKTQTNELSFIDKAIAARRLLYEMTGKGPNEATPTIPDGFVDKFREEMALPQDASKVWASYTTVFKVAFMSIRCWNILMEMELKAEKQPVFQPFQGLGEEKIYRLLMEVKDGYLTFPECSRKATQTKKFDVIRATFVNITGTRDWVEAKRRFSSFTTDDILKGFLKDFPTSTKSKKAIPAAFLDFCRRASESQNALSVDITVKVGGVDQSHLYKRIIRKYSDMIVKDISENESSIEPTMASSSGMESPNSGVTSKIIPVCRPAFAIEDDDDDVALSQMSMP
ncbi:uncharacterized protein LOC141912155 [Tubulanus polymorphus]|uniref:uncharacterized protein LOC141912155 n=1 Tax=Tubulanus polymorphus TaxID=672921 RepID=UPI003DA3C880